MYFTVVTDIKYDLLSKVESTVCYPGVITGPLLTTTTLET